jgi:UDP-N-acetylglucosamine 2-epimerase (non-hydrolysing)
VRIIENEIAGGPPPVRPLRIMTVAGTRPEAIKVAPIALAARRHPHIEHRLVATGQHADIFHDALASFGIHADDDLRLGAPGRDMDTLAALVADALPRLFDEHAPDMLLVQGDTTTAWAAALAAHAHGISVGHIEAGLRSHDPELPWPEERNRIEIDAIAMLLFAPTPLAAANLAAEPAVSGRIHVTGNTGIDALLWTRRQAPALLHDSGTRLILVTCHRRENFGEPLRHICDALVQLARREDVRIVLPVHPNPAIQGPVHAALADVPGISLIEPLPYPEMVRLMAAAHLLLTDSGGLQEEAPALGLPTLVLRDNTERPEALATGNLALVGTRTADIVAAAARLLDDPRAHAAMSHTAFPYGDGASAERIVSAIEEHHRGLARDRSARFV